MYAKIISTGDECGHLMDSSNPSNGLCVDGNSPLMFGDCRNGYSPQLGYCYNGYIE